MDKLSRSQRLKYARGLRRNGYSYAEIATHPSVQVSKSTSLLWCQSVELSPDGKRRLNNRISEKLSAAHLNSSKSRIAAKVRRQELAFKRAELAGIKLSDPGLKKALVGALYLAEGTKGDKRSSLTFGNSNPEIIALFMRLIRESFEINESKFRVTVQARASQDADELMQFWSEITRIPLSQFYDSRIDPRTIGKETLKTNYRGVCRIDYLSKELLYEVTALGTILTKGP